jgi:predicted dehydrogenase
MNQINRRNFVKLSASMGVVFNRRGSGLSRDRTYKTALVGTGWWGMNILRTALAAGRSRVVGMCDVDWNQLEPAAAEVSRLTGEEPRRYLDFRELLAGEKPEIVICATPDHWHPLVTIAALESGAHVYVEKPVGHTLREGLAMVGTARRCDRMVQVGTHRRVSPHNISGMKFLKSGRAGTITMVRAFVNYGREQRDEMTPDSEPPAGLDWDMWCGPAPSRPFNTKIHPRGFRQFLDYANGTLGDWGIHWLDQILWWTEEKFPQKVSSSGGRYAIQDNTDAPDTQIATFEFETFTAVWEHRFFGGTEQEKHRLGCYFFGTEGILHMGWLDGWTFYPRRKGDPVLHEEPGLHQPDDQNIPELWTDLLASIDTGRLPVCDIEIGHRSTSMSLLGMLSLKLGRSISWDGETETVRDDAEANRFLRRAYRQPWEYPEV